MIPWRLMACRGILIVEDEPMIRESLREALEFEGYKVFTAVNGRDAIETLSHIPHPCLILLDLMMPVMNGWEFLSHRCEDDFLAKIPVAVVTAAGEAKAQNLNAQVVIKKPIELELLLKWVSRYCGPSIVSAEGA
jgi:CheY-like chemotaxis protein